MQISSFDNFFKEILPILFNYLDENTRVECIKVNQLFKEIISSKLLHESGITPQTNKSYYVQLMTFYREYCHCIIRYFPINYFKVNAITSLTELKKNIDNQLQSVSLLADMVWNNYFKTFNSNINVKDDFLMLLKNQNIVRTEIFSRSIFYILSKPWCKKETLRQYLEAINTNIYVNSHDFLWMFMHFELPKEFAYILYNHIDMISKVDDGILLSAIKHKFSEEFIFLLLDKCHIQEEHLIFALRNKYSDHLIYTLTEKITCINEGILRAALFKKYQENVILLLLEKISMTSSVDFAIALDNRYSEKVLREIVNKIDRTNKSKMLVWGHILDCIKFNFSDEFMTFIDANRIDL